MLWRAAEKVAGHLSICAVVQDAAGGRSNVAEWVELSNGCLCCSVKDDFVQALESLMGQRSKFDHVLIETTGRCVSVIVHLRPFWLGW